MHVKTYRVRDWPYQKFGIAFIKREPHKSAWNFEHSYCHTNKLSLSPLTFLISVLSGNVFLQYYHMVLSLGIISRNILALFKS